jgi:putative ABC transport system permease protein
MFSRIRAWFRRSDRLPEEMQQHLEMLREERLARGATEDAADRFARAKLGNRRAIEETVYEMRPLYFFDAGARHLWLAVRTILRNKGSYLAAAGILALGVGMSVAIFSLVDAVLLRPLPFPRQESILVIWKVDPLAGQHVEELAYPELRDIQQNIHGLEYAAVMPTSLYGYAKVLQRGKEAPVQIESTPVSHDFFRVLGVAPALGRNFTDTDERVGAAPVVMLSDRAWREQLGADRKIVGQQIRMNGQGYTVIGVMPAGTEFPLGAGLWVPLGIDERVVTRRGATFLQAIIRLKPGIPRSRISGEVAALFRRLAAEHPDVYTRSQMGVVTPLADYLTGSARVHLWIMLAASVLLLAAANISSGNLLLSRTLARRHEIATRLALGAKRGQIIALLGAEGALVALIALVAGVGVAMSAIRVLVRLAPEDIPRLTNAALDPDSFWFAASSAALAAFACTVIPAWAAARMPLESALREGGVRLSLSGRANRTRNVFIVVQAAVTLMLLATAALFVLSYRSMMSAGTGFANRKAVTMNLQLHGPGLFSAQAFTLESRRQFYGTLLSRVRATPGMTAAAALLLRPLEGTVGWDVPYEFEFQTGGRDGRVLPKVNFEVVTPDYFRTLGIALLEGRDFNEHDSATSEPVVVISRSLAERVRRAGRSALGSRIRLGSGARWNKVVGVASDARYRSIAQVGEDIYASYLQAPQPTNYVVVSGIQPAAQLSALVRARMAELDPNQAIAGVATMGELIDRNAARHRFNLILLLWFGVCAAILASSGIYSVIAETMTARQREIAVRIALGAGKRRLVRDMLSGTMFLVVSGECVGAFAIALLMGADSTLLYGVSARDPRVLGLVAGFLFVVSFGAAFWPAWNAAGRDPQASLRAN